MQSSICRIITVASSRRTKELSSNVFGLPASSGC